MITDINTNKRKPGSPTHRYLVPMTTTEATKGCQSFSFLSFFFNGKKPVLLLHTGSTKISQMVTTPPPPQLTNRKSESPLLLHRQKILGVGEGG